MQKTLSALAIIIGILLLIVAFLYFTEPARLLPSFLPGHQMTSVHHYKHGIGAFLLALALFAFVWFQTGKKH